MEQKPGMVSINWNMISPKVQSHGMCSVANCYEPAEFMKKYQKGYRIFCKKHASTQE